MTAGGVVPTRSSRLKSRRLFLRVALRVTLRTHEPLTLRCLNPRCILLNPTASPTSSPTAGPTAGPSASPTASPTANPTSSPTAGPPASPSDGEYYFGDCQIARHQTADYLDRQLAQCGGPGRAMQNLTFGQFGCKDSNYMRYRLGCTSSGVASQVETKYTPCQELTGLESLDQQQLRCSAGYALTDFVMQGCGGLLKRYKYHCTQLENAQSVYT
eukprot:Rhum_TRINITY_DN15116_c8_g2::Rhum_TRINITY_DN15116_c8_g2_i12::g.139040::m.139040